MIFKKNITTTHLLEDGIIEINKVLNALEEKKSGVLVVLVA